MYVVYLYLSNKQYSSSNSSTVVTLLFEPALTTRYLDHTWEQIAVILNKTTTHLYKWIDLKI